MVHQRNYCVGPEGASPGVSASAREAIAAWPAAVAASRDRFLSASEFGLDMSDAKDAEFKTNRLLSPARSRTQWLRSVPGRGSIVCQMNKRAIRQADEQQTVTLPYPSMTLISMFLAPVCTTSRSDLTVSLMLSSRVRSSLWFFSRNSRTVFEDRPMALA